MFDNELNLKFFQIESNRIFLIRKQIEFESIFPGLKANLSDKVLLITFQIFLNKRENK